MKKLIKYINEAAELEVIKTEYREYGVVTLVRRENVNCARLSKEKFIEYMKEDLQKAVNEYTKIVQPLNDQKIKDNIESDVRAAIAYASKKWKTQKKRDEYVETARKNAETKKWYLDDPKRIFFDLKPDLGRMGIPEVCILKYDDTDEKLGRCYDEIKDIKYFKKAKGWAFKYESNTKDKIGTYSFRPYIDLILDDSTKAEQKRDEENLAQAVADFYKNTKYWGD